VLTIAVSVGKDILPYPLIARSICQRVDRVLCGHPSRPVILVTLKLERSK
jgi:hypothetical protein